VWDTLIDGLGYLNASLRIRLVYFPVIDFSFCIPKTPTLKLRGNRKGFIEFRLSLHSCS
jgi:hypothetical protein